MTSLQTSGLAQRPVVATVSQAGVATVLAGSTAGGALRGPAVQNVQQPGVRPSLLPVDISFQAQLQQMRPEQRQAVLQKLHAHRQAQLQKIQLQVIVYTFW